MMKCVNSVLSFISNGMEFSFPAMLVYFLFLFKKELEKFFDLASQSVNWVEINPATSQAILLTIVTILIIGDTVIVFRLLKKKFTA